MWQIWLTWILVYSLAAFNMADIPLFPSPVGAAPLQGQAPFPVENLDPRQYLEGLQAAKLQPSAFSSAVSGLEEGVGFANEMQNDAVKRQALEAQAKEAETNAQYLPQKLQLQAAAIQAELLGHQTQALTAAVNFRKAQQASNLFEQAAQKEQNVQDAFDTVRNGSLEDGLNKLDQHFLDLTEVGLPYSKAGKGDKLAPDPAILAGLNDIVYRAQQSGRPELVDKANEIVNRFNHVAVSQKSVGLGLSPEAATSAVAGNPLAKKRLEYFNLFSNTMPQVQAAKAAGEAMAAEIGANKATFNKEAKVQETVSKLRELTGKVQAAIDSGAYTGIGGTVDYYKNKVLSLVSEDNANAAAAQGLYSSIVPDVVGMGRPPGVRLTQAEWNALVAAKPSLTKPPAENQLLNNVWKATADDLSRYADLLASVREVGGTQSDADRIWDIYQKNHPLLLGFDKEGLPKLNPDKTDWTDIWNPTKPIPSPDEAPKEATKVINGVTYRLNSDGTAYEKVK